MRTVTASRFHTISGVSNNDTEIIRTPEFTTLIHAESTVTITETIVFKECLDKSARWIFAGSEENPGVSSLGIGNEEIGVVVIVRGDNASGAGLFLERVRTGTHEAKVHMEARPRKKCIHRDCVTLGDTPCLGIVASLAGMKRMDSCMQTRR